MKKWTMRFVPLFGALLLVGAGCFGAKTRSNVNASGTNASNASDVNASAVNAGVNAGANVNAEADVNAGLAARTIKVKASQFKFDPVEINVKLGEKVKLEIESLDVDHGFALPTFNVNAMLKAGTTTTVEFTADKKGNYPFFCSVFCGSGHGNMRGAIIVE